MGGDSFGECSTALKRKEFFCFANFFRNKIAAAQELVVTPHPKRDAKMAP
jgi:hypothetical protein